MRPRRPDRPGWRSGVGFRIEAGQSTVEFALIASAVVLLLLGIIDFGLLFQQAIGVTNGARSGARWAIVHPAMWSNADPAPPGTIQGAIQNAGAMYRIPNDDQHISITYLAVNGNGSTTTCGSYTTASGFVAAQGYTQATCLVPGNIIQVKVSYTYSYITPITAWIASLKGGTVLTSTATMMEEQ